MAKTKTVAKQQTRVINPPDQEYEHLSIIARVYLQTITGLEIWERPDADEHIKAIWDTSAGDDRPYIFYEERGEPVYMAIKNGKYQTMSFPQPGNAAGQAGMTSMELYSYAITLAQGVEKIVELETEPKPSLLDQARKVMTPTIVIVACVVALFLIIAMMRG